MFKKIIELLKRKYSEVFFIGSDDKLPPPLNREEELSYLVKAKSGDIEARNVLIEHNLRLVVFLAKKYESTGYPLEDLVSIGSIGLIKGINTYKIDKNIKLATYASRCIANEILMYIRKNKRRKTEISLEDAIEIIKRNSRRYAKRQYTWINNKMNVKWFYVDFNNFNNTIKEVEKYITD